jgi:hypothetical protein
VEIAPLAALKSVRIAATPGFDTRMAFRASVWNAIL